VAAPLALDENGAAEDSAWRFPTPLKILCKALGGCKGGDYIVKDEAIFPDWVGGMFMLFRRETFEQLCGFDRLCDTSRCRRTDLFGQRWR
jgi:hypothetical protein